MHEPDQLVPPTTVTGRDAAAGKPTFADLLAHAKAEVAAGHRFDPPGDNLMETTVQIVDLASTATPAELVELSKLLQSDPPLTSAEPSSAPSISLNPPLSRPRATVCEPDPLVPLTTVTGRDATALAPSALLDAIIKGATPPPSGATLRQDVFVSAHPRGNDPNAEHPDARAADFYIRGKGAERLGDISGARRLYAAAAQLNDAAAAQALGHLYDPAYLRQATIGGVSADPELARRWYERAIALGNSQAALLLQALAVR